MEQYADIIVDILHSSLDKAFQYRIPEKLTGQLEAGDVVEIPFGRGDRPTKGYVLRVTEHSEYPAEKLKSVAARVTGSGEAEDRLVTLALWMRDYYGSTTLQALRTVLPFRSQVKEKKKKRIVLAVPGKEAQELLTIFRRKHQTARARLLEALLEEPELPQEAVTGVLKVTNPVLHALEERGIIRCESEHAYRMPAVLEQLRAETQENGAISASALDQTPAVLRQPCAGTQENGAISASALDQMPAVLRQPCAETQEKEPAFVSCFSLTEEQKRAVETVCKNWKDGIFSEYLLYGVTGSGKTAVYMELIAECLRRGRQAILLIPEISLTYQNVIRFYHAFGDRISILHSRLSKAERFDQFERAQTGNISVMIGPRSALFTPFSKLGLIIIDEEHEPSYRSETTPRYDARETARKRAMLEGAQLVLGSATPSLESYWMAQQGQSTLLTMKHRPSGARLPVSTVVDMRKEIRSGNSSILSRTLSKRLQDCLKKGRQAMLFLNRRGYAGFVSCRSCGHVIKCPHCDVSLSLHSGGKLICHYCGYQEEAVKKCPSCGSAFIGGFKAGTQQIEAIVAKEFPEARILRMDADTTRGQDGHAEILRAFGRREADILIGTQMIVKGHDFPGVALVGVLAADLSLNAGDFRAAERTYQLLTQAAGRAGRGELPGEVVIQTYQPEHYAVTCAAGQTYEPFFEQEMHYRRLSGYPPAGGLLAVHCQCGDQEQLAIAAEYLAKFAGRLSQRCGIIVLGPSQETVAKIKDVYRMAIYIRHEKIAVLTAVKNMMEQYIGMNRGFDSVKINFER